MNVLIFLISFSFFFTVFYCGFIGANEVLSKWYGIKRTPFSLVVIWPFIIVTIGLKEIFNVLSGK